MYSVILVLRESVCPVSISTKCWLLFAPVPQNLLYSLNLQDSGELDIRGNKAQLTRASPQQQKQSQQQQQSMMVSTGASYLEERADRMEELEVS